MQFLGALNHLMEAIKIRSLSNNLSVNLPQGRRDLLRGIFVYPVGIRSAPEPMKTDISERLQGGDFKRICSSIW